MTAVADLDILLGKLDLAAKIRLLTGGADRASREVVQVYLSPAESEQPVRLVGWATADVPAGGSARVVVRTDPRMWRRWDAAAGGWSALRGGELLVARGLGDVRLRLPLDQP